MTRATACHERIAKTAKAFAGEWYEERAKRDDAFFHEWPRERDFIRKNWRSFVGPARTILTAMLGQNHVPADQKEEIYEALILDGGINPRGAHTPLRLLN